MRRAGEASCITVVADMAEGPAGPSVETRTYMRRDVERWSWGAVDGILAGEVPSDDFALGFVACLDMLSSGGLGAADPVDVIRAAWNEANGVPCEARVLTEALRRNCARAARGRG